MTDYKKWFAARHGNEPFQLYASYFDNAQLSHLNEGPDGSRTVSSGMLDKTRPDPGGVSYGSFQFTSQYQYRDKAGKLHTDKGGTVKEFMSSEAFRPFAAQFKGKDGKGFEINSKEFKAAWSNVKGPIAFEHAQYDFAMERYYEPGMQRLEAHKIPVKGRSEAFGNAVTSAMVQHGQNSTVVVDGMNRKASGLGKPVASLNDREAIQGIFEERARVNHTTVDRYKAEMRADLEMLYRERPDLEPPGSAPFGDIQAERDRRNHHGGSGGGRHGQGNIVGEVVGEVLKGQAADRGAQMKPGMAADMSVGRAAQGAVGTSSNGPPPMPPGMAAGQSGVAAPMQPQLGADMAAAGADPMAAAINVVQTVAGQIDDSNAKGRGGHGSTKDESRKKNTAGNMVDDYQPGMTPR